MLRTHYCGELRAAHLGQSVTLCGWVSRIRNLGGLFFIDMRDREGLVQVSFPAGDISEQAQSLGREYVIRVEGKVSARPTANAKIANGEVEVVATRLTILSESATPPYELDEPNVSEELKLKYRYYDLRRPELTHNMILRSKTASVVRKYYEENGFVEVETPVLMRSTPEGARDYVVPSRVHHGEFYALPQSPQQYKQLLMVGGIDRYYQIVKCFRDEDLRADRQPEFTQIDVEMSYVETEDVMQMGEALIKRILKEVAGYEMPPIPRMSYDEAMRRYGIDKPDLRFDLEITDATTLLNNCGFKGIDETIANGGIVVGIKVPGASAASRKQLDGWQDAAKKMGLAGLITWKETEEGTISSIGKFISPELLHTVAGHFNMRARDMVFLAAGKPEKLYPAFGNLRLQWAKEFKLIDEKKWAPLWITDFPAFEWDVDRKRWSAMHNPFSALADPEKFVEMVEHDFDKLGELKAKQYDMVLNGNEIGGGSIRNHRSEVQRAVFKALGLSDEEAKDKFGFFVEALTYGTPPHGGIAFGFDRIVALLCGSENIRDVIAFPKTTTASSLMDGSPSPIAPEQLDELGIKVV